MRLEFPLPVGPPSQQIHLVWKWPWSREFEAGFLLTFTFTFITPNYSHLVALELGGLRPSAHFGLRVQANKVPLLERFWTALRLRRSKGPGEASNLAKRATVSKICSVGG